RGMSERGIDGAAQEQIVKSITSFALYGFPESHAASFALIAYASAYLKAHHPAAFYAAILNSWPMGFYHPATLVKDAQRHGTPVRPIDVTRSGWKCRWDEGAVRIGLRYVQGLKEATGKSIEAEQERRACASVDDLARRCALREDELVRLAYAGALASFGRTRRGALWQGAEGGGTPRRRAALAVAEGRAPLRGALCGRVHGRSVAAARYDAAGGDRRGLRGRAPD